MEAITNLLCDLPRTKQNTLDPTHIILAKTTKHSLVNVGSKVATIVIGIIEINTVKIIHLSMTLTKY